MPRDLVRMPPRPIEAARSTLVRAIMTPDPVTVGPDIGLEHVIELFVARNLGHVPVVDADGRAIGMISKSDVVRDMHVRGDTHVDQSRQTAARGVTDVPEGTHVHEVDDRARDVMTPIALWLPETASIAEAATVLAEGTLHAVLIADNDRRVVGILSTTDVVAWVAGTR